MSELQSIADKLWTGELSTAEPGHHPFAPYGLSDEVAPGVIFFKDFVNVTGVRTGEGLVMIDTGSYTAPQHMRCFNGIRSHFSDLLHTAIYTHGHVDHAYGLPPYLKEIRTQGARYPQIIGHEHVAPRMDRYVETEAYNNVINERQFGAKMHWPTDPVKPTVSYRDGLDVTIGETQFRLTHTRGETDDHTWVYLPNQKVLCTGDLFIWASPNAGNPQKVQRYAIEWARGLRQMATLGAEVLLPGHGVPVYGSSHVTEALETTASYLESLYGQTLTMLNEGARIYDIIETVKVPEALQSVPWLQPIYDEPDFIVRNIVRHLGGWYSGVPSELKPAPRVDLAREIVGLAGGVEALLARARKLIDEQRHDVAAHLIDYAIDAEPKSGEVKALRHAIYTELSEKATSTMSKGIYNAAARDSEA